MVGGVLISIEDLHAKHDRMLGRRTGKHPCSTVFHLRRKILCILCGGFGELYVCCENQIVSCAKLLFPRKYLKVFLITFFRTLLTVLGVGL